MKNFLQIVYKLTLLLAFVLITQMAFSKENSTLTEGFNETTLGTSYGNYTVNGWSIINALRETADKYEGLYAIRFNKVNQGGVKSIKSPEKTGGIGTVSLYHRRWSSSDGNVTYSLFKSIDGVNWGTAITTFQSTSDTYSLFSFDVNDASAKYIKIESAASNGRSLIDLISITDYAAPATPPVISNITRTPSGAVTSSQSVSVSADVTDADGTISQVKLNWGTSSGNLPNEIIMNNSGGNIYSTSSSIPAQLTGTTIYYTISATDNQTNTTTSSEQSYLVQNPSSNPVISNITRTPLGSVTSSNSVSISADITDVDGLFGAELHWGTSTGAYSANIDMTLASGNTYTTSINIPVQDDGTTVYYEIYAIDNISNETTTAEQSYLVQDASTATITPSITSLNFNNVYAGNVSEAEFYTFSATGLTQNVVVTAPTGFEVSSACTSGFAGSVSISHSGGTITNAKVYVRFAPSSLGTFAGNISHTSAGATTKNISVSETNSATNLPAGYYTSATGTGTTLLNNLHNLIDNHTVRSYTQLWTDFQTTDTKPNGKVWDMYSDKTCDTDPYEFTFSTNQCGTYNSEADCYNREHSFPKSWWGGTEDDQYTDLFHLVPTDGYVNAGRSNYEFGEVSSGTTYGNGSKVGANTYSGSSGATAFEPIDEYKGDFARSYFYMATRYSDLINSWTTSPMIDGDVNDADGSTFEEWALNMLVAWHNADPVSQKERNRNDAVYGIQGNRNPFIDHPEWVSSIWANAAPTLNSSKNSITGFTYVSGSGPSVSQNFTLSGNNLDGSSVSITAPTNFEISTDNTNFSASLTINYTAPTLSSTIIYVRLVTGLVVNTYNGTLTANDNGTATDLNITLSGEVSSSGSGGSGCAGDLIISEYIEGSGNNKYIEISNFTGTSVNLANYQLLLFSNGVSTASNTHTLSGTLADGESMVYRNSSASQTQYSTSTAVAFSGNDAIALYKISPAGYVDIIGEIGDDPGSAWTSGSHSTVNKTLVRKASVTQGVSTNLASGFPTLTTEWDVYNQDVITYLGSHTMDCVQEMVDWCNLQWTATTTITKGADYWVYARVYEPGITNAVGQGANIEAWIGYSTDNTNPNTWTNWILAVYNADDGTNNDEYKANLGTLPEGTYYYASRFKVTGSSAYSYGGYNGGFWDGTTNTSQVLTINPAVVDWCNLQHPQNGTIEKGMNYDVYAQVLESGITNPAGQGANIEAWIGYSTTNTDPSTWTNWTTAAYNTDNGNNDEYKVSFSSALPEGTYYYASRFRLNGSEYRYGGYNAGGGGYWDLIDDISGVLTVTATNASVPNTQVTGTSISSLADTEGEAVNVFKFKLTDSNLDSKDTKITKLRFKPNTTNTVSWSGNIQGVKIAKEGAPVTIGTPTINDTYIDIPIAAGDLLIEDDGTDKELTLSVYLKTSGLTDNAILSFMLDADLHGFTTDATGSFVRTTVNSGVDIVSNDFTIDVTASQIVYASNTPPSSAVINTNFALQVNATDANGNLDLNANNEITLSKASGTGNLISASGLVKNLSAGAYSWSDLQFNAADTYTLTATSDLGNITSGNIVVISCTPAADGSGVVTIENVAADNLNTYNIWRPANSAQAIKINLSSSNTNCLTSVEIDFNSMFSGLDIANVTLSGSATNGNTTKVENTDNILTIDNLILTNTNALTISATALNTNSLSDVTDIGQRTISVKTKGNGTLTALGTQPEAFFVIPLANAKKLSGSTLINRTKKVVVEGVSTVASHRLCSNSGTYDQFFIQEGNGALAKGICIHQTSFFSPVRDIAKKYVVKGTLALVKGNVTTATDAYANMTALTAPELILDMGDATLPTPYIVKIDDGASSGLFTMSNAAFEEVDGLLMRIQSIRKASGTWPTSNSNLANIYLYDVTSSKDLRCFIFANTNIGGNPEPDWASGNVDMATLVYNYDATGSGVEDRQITPIYYDNFFKAIVWDNSTGNGLWADAKNWSPNVLPQEFDDIVFDNITGPAGNYNVELNVASASINSLTLSPDAGNVITFTIPNTNSTIPAITLNTDDEALVIKNGGIFINQSTALSGDVIDMVGTSPIFKIENGGKYIHKTSTPNANLIDRLSSEIGTEDGTFEFDVARNIDYPISLSGRTYGNLVLSATTNTPVYTVSGSNLLTVKGNFILNTNSQFNENSFTGNILLAGDLTNNATAWTFGSVNTLTFNGTQKQTVSGAFSNFDKNVIIANAAGVEIDNIWLLTGNLPTLTINTSAKLSVLPNKGLTVEGAFTNNGNIYLKSPTNSGAAGSLITLLGSETIANASVERFIPFGEWHYVASPISNAKSDLFTTSTSGWNPNFFYYNEAEDVTPNPSSASYTNWNLFSTVWKYAHNGQAGVAANLEVGKGYASIDNAYRTVTFEGTFNNGDISIPVTYTANDANAGYFDGWNLIGNPFPSAIDWDNVDWDKSKIDNTLYLYEEDRTTGLKRYWYYNGAGGTAIDLGGVSLNSQSSTPNIIPAMQGFFVKANASGNVVIPNSARTHSTQVFWKQKNEPTNLLRLRVEGNKLSDETIVRFAPDATPLHDSYYDAYKMQSQGDKLPQLFSLANTIPLAINTLPETIETTIVPLGFACKLSGNYTISAKEVFFDLSEDIYLVDKQVKRSDGSYQKVNLRETPSYTFEFDGGLENNRFEIHFSKTTTHINPTEDFASADIFTNESTLFVRILDTNFKTTNLTVYNLLGEKVLQQMLLTNGLHTIDMSSQAVGVYVVKLESESFVVSKKVIKN